MMKVLKSKITLICIGLVVSIMAGLFGSAVSNSIVLNPTLNRLGLIGVAGDGWSEPKAYVDLSKFSAGITKAYFRFDAWRPAGNPAAKLTFLACDRQLASFVVKSSNPIFLLEVPSDCAPKQIELAVENPFKSTDGRMLGVRVVDVTLNYDLVRSLKFDAKSLLVTFGLFLIFLALFCLRLSPIQLVVAIGALASTSVWAMKSLAWDNQWQLFSLAIVLALFIFGLHPRLSQKLSFSPAEALSARASTILVFIVVIFGALIRFYGTDFGLPHRYHPDEPRKASIALRMAVLGDFDPKYFLHPTLLLYLTALYGKVGHFLGLFPELNSVAMNLSGRLVSATAGTLAVPFLYLLGRDLLSTRVGLLASAAFAFAPLHVTCSRYLKEDALLTMFVLLGTWLSVRAVKRDRPRELLPAAFVIGLAASSKYSGALGCVAIALTPWLRSRSLIPDWRFLLWGAASAVFVPVGFILASPYTVLNFSKFINHFQAEQQHMLAGHHRIVISGWSQYWMYHLSRSVLPGATWVVTFLGLFGFGALVRSAGMRGFYVLAVFLAFYLPAEAVNAKPPPQPERYILPCIPFLFLAGAFAVDSMRKFGGTILSCALGCALFLSPFYISMGLAWELKPDSRVKMEQWIRGNIPEGSKILIDAQAYSAFLPQDKFVVVPMWSIADRRAMTLEKLKSDGIDYVLFTNKSFERYFLTQSADQLIRTRFQEIFDKWILVKEVKSGFGSYGFNNPELRLYKVQMK